MKRINTLLWAIFLLMMSILIKVIDINYILPKLLDITSSVLLIGAIGLAIYTWFIDDKDKDNT